MSGSVGFRDPGANGGCGCPNLPLLEYEYMGLLLKYGETAKAELFYKREDIALQDKSNTVLLAGIKCWWLKERDAILQAMEVEDKFCLLRAEYSQISKR